MKLKFGGRPVKVSGYVNVERCCFFYDSIDSLKHYFINKDRFRIIIDDLLS